MEDFLEFWLEDIMRPEMTDQYKGYQYYKENPSLTAWEAIEKILKDCELIV